MMHLDIVGSAFAISMFLLIYYAAVGFFTVYFTTLFGYSLSKANSIGNWYWAFDAGALIVTGIISDRFRVRKPFMVVGGIGAIVMTIVFLNLGSHDLVLDDRGGHQRHRGVPRHRVRAVDGELHRDGREAQPGADGDRARRLGLDHPRRGRALRAVPAAGRQLDDAACHLRRRVATLSAQYSSELATAQAIDPATQATLQASPTNTAALAKAVGEIATTFKVTPAEAQTSSSRSPRCRKSDLLFLRRHGKDVATRPPTHRVSGRPGGGFASAARSSSCRSSS